MGNAKTTSKGHWVSQWKQNQNWLIAKSGKEDKEFIGYRMSVSSLVDYEFWGSKLKWEEKKRTKNTPVLRNLIGCFLEDWKLEKTDQITENQNSWSGKYRENITFLKGSNI